MIELKGSQMSIPIVVCNFHSIFWLLYFDIVKNLTSVHYLGRTQKKKFQTFQNVVF
jgi:hypothetical protein